MNSQNVDVDVPRGDLLIVVRWNLESFGVEKVHLDDVEDRGYSRSAKRT
jgi:hypothetical protein